jgi:hypothetical protein
MVYWTHYCGGSIAGWFVYESLLCCREVIFFSFFNCRCRETTINRRQMSLIKFDTTVHREAIFLKLLQANYN